MVKNQGDKSNSSKTIFGVEIFIEGEVNNKSLDVVVVNWESNEA